MGDIKINWENVAYYSGYHSGFRAGIEAAARVVEASSAWVLGGSVVPDRIRSLAPTPEPATRCRICGRDESEHKRVWFKGNLLPECPAPAPGPETKP